MNFGGGLKLGGAELVPELVKAEDHEEQPTDTTRNITTVEKHIRIVEYLKKLPTGVKASSVDIFRELSIDINNDVYVLGMIKSNPKIDIETVEGELRLEFRNKFQIRTKTELLTMIKRVRNGIVFNDIKDCYTGIEGDVMSLIVGGDIIAVKNKELKSLVLYPRGEPFLSKLSGTVTATPTGLNAHRIKTSVDLRGEIRRGEAIQVGDYWYRVGSSVGSSQNQTQRSVAPTSVTSDREMSDRNVYIDPFNAETLPLDGDFEGSDTYNGVAVRHGCTLDIKTCWSKTLESLQPFHGEDTALHRELVTLNLISRPLSTAQQNKRKIEKKEKTKRKPRKKQVTAVNRGGSVYGMNTHLKGTGLEKILQETRQKLIDEENAKL